MMTSVSSEKSETNLWDSKQSLEIFQSLFWDRDQKTSNLNFDANFKIEAKQAGGWVLKLKLEVSDCNCSLKFKFDIDIWTWRWNLKLNFEVEVWIWSLKLKF